MNLKNCYRITMAAIAITGATVLSSCSHDDYYYNEEKAEQSVNDKYAIAFEKAFGKVGPNVDWGFSSKNTNARAFTRALGTYAQYRGHMQPTLDPPFPSDCAASNFLKEEDIPAGVGKLPTWGAGPGSYYIEGNYNVVSTWSGASKIYVKGTVDLSDGDGDESALTWNFMPSNTSEIYLTEGSKLILGEASALNFNVDAIYIAPGATLETAFKLQPNNATRIYNHGTIKVGSFKPNTSSFLYNVGTLEAGEVTAESNDSRIVNDGTINCASVTVNAGAVQNNAEWTVFGTTKVNSPNSGWVNNGHWTTYDYEYVGGSWNVINNCFLEVENDFAMNISSEKGAFQIDGGGGVLTKYFDGGRSSTGAVSGPFVIIMGSKAVFVVSDTAILESGRGDENGFGIFGPSEGEYAVFQATTIARDPYLESIKSHGAVTYGGNLYVSAETHFAQGYDSDGSGTYTPQPFIYGNTNNIYAPGFNSGKPNITISSSPCSPGFQGDDPNPTYRVIAEDLNAMGNTDFDFNDVVFDVEPNEAGTAAKITVLAAGGIYRLEVDGVEVHKALLGGDGQINENGFYPMINTGDGPQVDPAVIRTAYAGNFSTDENIRATIKNITVKVWKPQSNNSNDVVECTLSANRGEPASKVLVDKSFGIVPEHHSIADSYGNFTNYVQGEFQDDFWWK